MIRRLIVLVSLTAIMLAGAVAGPATQPPPARGWLEFQLISTGSAAAWLEHRGARYPVDTNTLPGGWLGIGTLVIEATGSCRIVIDGVVVAEAAGPVAVCSHP
jgi:hypothetical protein